MRIVLDSVLYLFLVGLGYQLINIDGLVEYGVIDHLVGLLWIHLFAGNFTILPVVARAVVLSIVRATGAAALSRRLNFALTTITTGGFLAYMFNPLLSVPWRAAWVILVVLLMSTVLVMWGPLGRAGVRAD